MVYYSKFIKYLSPVIVMIIITILILFPYGKPNQLSKRDVFDCKNFVSIFYHNFHYRFNIPVFIVLIKADNYSHCINGVLIGDSSLQYNDWYFIEPQNDFTFERGKPNIPNSTVSIIAPKELTHELERQSFDNFDFIEAIRFKFDDKGNVRVDYYHPGLVLSKQDAIKLNSQDSIKE